MKHLLFAFLVTVSANVSAHTLMCDHIHRPDGSIKYDCRNRSIALFGVSETIHAENDMADLFDLPHEDATTTMTEECHSTFYKPAQPEILYCSYVQEYEEFFSKAADTQTREDRTFCEEAGMKLKFVSIGPISCTHPHGDRYCHQRCSFRCIK